MNFEKQFKKEISFYTDDELIEIVRESLDFYSDEEVEIIKDELASREISLSVMNEIKQLTNDYIDDYRKQEIAKNIETQKQIRQDKEKDYEVALSVLKQNGVEGYWEYEVVDIIDKFGRIDSVLLKDKLNDLAIQGWRLKCAYSNEIGKNAVSVMGLGNNSTVEQNVLIFERFVKFE